MKKLTLLIYVIAIMSNISLAQTANDKLLYNPSDDAQAEIANAVEKAQKEGKHVFLQIGGNWCKWCHLFDRKVQSNDTLRTFMENNFVIYHVNYSKENKNEEVLASLGYPQRFGFPVFVILDEKGNRLHTQNSVYLEEGQGHSAEKILAFFNHWSPEALDPESYE